MKRETAKILTPIKSRILQFIDYKGINKAFFFEKIGIASTNFRGEGARSDLGTDKIVKILTEFPEINPEWLLIGKGEMLRSEYPIAQQAEVIKEPSVSLLVGDGVMSIYKELLREKDEKIAHQAEWIGELKTENRYQNEQNEELSEINIELERKNEELSIRSNSMEIENETLKNLIEELQEKLELYEYPKP